MSKLRSTPVSKPDQAQGEGALQRWSRRKAAARKPDPSQVAPSPEVQGAEPAEAAAARTGPADQQADAREPPLPALDQLDINSDFSAFLRQSVDPAVRRAALRKLWTLDPSLTQPDGLVEYGGDYTDAAKATAVVRTAYRVVQRAAWLADDAGGAGAAEPTEEQAANDAPSGDAPSGAEPDGRSPERQSASSDEPAASDDRQRG